MENEQEKKDQRELGRVVNGGTLHSRHEGEQEKYCRFFKF